LLIRLEQAEQPRVVPHSALSSKRVRHRFRANLGHPQTISAPLEVVNP